MSEKMREAIVAYMAAGVGNSTDYEKQAHARRLATEALAEQPAPALPDGWLRAIDEAMVVHHAGVANAADTYEEARLKINLLLCIAQDIGALHAVPEGWKLVPERLPEAMERVGEATLDHDGTLKQMWANMLAAAPEVEK